ncbi:FAD:protein FMN transferase [Effusibacillus dendaii]|uniref:FAD:protein FMN transferase n=1 Tax=Effusibacillus dendaii TaxID=2743772 RepID=A0A7I8DAP9_9BACL|nr:FAD:protein FMN transferase [Effusibacillus dendaii]BCJ86029.1 FAD:protein FMN transferase [Effusibacillus dendaii]
MSEQRLSFQAMNTHIEVLLETENPIRSQQEIEFALRRTRMFFHQMEAICSRFRPESELSRLNRHAGQTMAVSSLLFAVLQAAANAFQETDGLYHPGLLHQLELTRYDRSFELILAQGGTDNINSANIHSETSANTTCKTAARDCPFELDANNLTVRIQKGIKIDLGGIAKGWTVDHAASFLEKWGCGFVNAGGDLRIFGKRRGPWLVGVENPFDTDSDLTVLSLYSGAVATSSRIKRSWNQGRKRMHHLIDPRTGLPMETQTAAATVTAPTACQADVWAKVMVLLDRETAFSWIEKRGQQAIVVDENGQVWGNEYGLA